MFPETLKKVVVIGAGQIGPDIALHFAKTLSSKGVVVYNLDIAESALEKAKAKAHKKIAKALDTGAFKEEQAQRIKSALCFSTDYENIKGAALVVEAATEDENIKDKIFRQVETLTDENCIYLSNSSHMQPEVIFRNIKNKRRCAVAHYFFPAEINPVIEIVPGVETDLNLCNVLLKFYESIGKIPILVKSSYGYAIDPIFEGICQTAVLCLERNWGSEKEIDAAAVKALGLGVGPFTALNLTGGNPITSHGLNEMHSKINPWFKTPNALMQKAEKKELWQTASKGEIIELNSEKEKMLVEEFQGAYFALACMILDLKISNVSDLNMACELSLVIRPPFSMMNEMGLKKSRELIGEFCIRNPEFKLPASIEAAEKSGSWKINDITSVFNNGVQVITIRRPKVLNALNLEVLKQIQEEMERHKGNSEVKGIVLTGFGLKAFVSGADINMLSSLQTPEEGFSNSQTFQAVLNYIENYSKPVVCAMNGFAFGGGNELALACTTRICKKGLKVLVCQPEVNLGFIPGAGGTQRLPRLIGVEKAAEILRTGRPVSADEAQQLGLIQDQVEGDLIEASVQLVKDLVAGNKKAKEIIKDPMNTGTQPDVLDIGHLSKAIDQIMVKAIYEGTKLNLRDALTYESKMFAECMKTDDMKIGLDNFKKFGARSHANFVHH